MSPEDGLNMVLKQKWISSKQAREVAMLTQYVFGLMDPTYYQVLCSRVKGKTRKVLFAIAYKIGIILVRIRWKFKYFGVPIDYWFFTLVYKHGGLI